MTSRAGWEEQAQNWATWARTPGHDVYWVYRDRFFDEIVPPPGRATLEVGCGEGRVARDLRDRGHRVTAIDGSPTLLALASEADPDGDYRLADAADLPFEAGRFDLVVAHNSLMDFDDLEGSVAECARVLEPGGRLAASIAHPLSDAGRFDGDEPDAAFVVKYSYFGSRRLEETFARDGLEICFHGYIWPLEAYMRALENAGFLVLRMREPAHPTAPRWRRLPIFLHLLAERR